MTLKTVAVFFLVAENENLMASVEKPVIEMEYSCLLRFMVVYNI